MKKIFISLLVIMFVFAPSYADAPDEGTVEAMAEFDKIMENIGRLPVMIDEDLCSNDRDAYRRHMTEFAQSIIDANSIIKDLKLYYPVYLWAVYNRISRNPVCGTAADAAAEAFRIADVSRVSNEEKMGILQNDDVCMCWNIATGRDEPTGFMKDGACRCTYGINAFSPNIGRN